MDDQEETVDIRVNHCRNVMVQTFAKLFKPDTSA